MKRALLLFVLLLNGSFATTVTLNDPSQFNFYGANSLGYSVTTDTSLLINSSSSIKINKWNGIWAGVSYTSESPIVNVTYYQFDPGPSANFYNYFFLGSEQYLINFMWRDRGYQGTIGVEGPNAENYFPYGDLKRTYGWHKIEAAIDNQYINYKLDDIAVARFSNTNQVTKLMLEIAGGAGNYNIANV